MDRKEDAFMFVDGENLAIRYAASLEKYEAAGRPSIPDVIYEPGIVFWHRVLVEIPNVMVRRVEYYTVVPGDEQRVNEIAAKLAEGRFKSPPEPGQRWHGKVIPRIFRKANVREKTKSVDVNIAVDMLRYAHQPWPSVFVFVGGDRDYLPLIREVMRQGKNVMVMALSDGLDKGLREEADVFYSLDGHLFPNR